MMNEEAVAASHSSFRIHHFFPVDNLTHSPRSLRAKRRGSSSALRTTGARVLLDFARFPAARVLRDDAGKWVVQFSDLRFVEPGARAPAASPSKCRSSKVRMKFKV
jgi:hypothetical protein